MSATLRVVEPLKPPPQNIEAEQAVLGILIMHTSALDEVAAILKPDDFYRTAHRVIYSAILKMRDEGRSVDIVTLHDFLRSKGEALDEVGGSNYLTYLPETVASSEPEFVEYHAQQVKEAANARKRVEGSIRATQSFRDGDDLHQVLTGLSEIVEASTVGDEGGLKPIPLSELSSGDIVEPFYPGMFYPESITLLSSEPGIGKTSFVKDFSIHAVLGREYLGVPFPRPLRVVDADLESPGYLIKRKYRDVLPDDLQDLPDGITVLQDVTLADLPALARFCKEEKIDIVIIDTLSMYLGAAVEDEKDNSQESRAMGEIKSFCLDTGCAVVLIHHLAKGADPSSVYATRGASALAASADVLINIEGLEKDTLKIWTPKNKLESPGPPLYIRKIGGDRFEPYTPPEGSSGFEVFEVQDFILALKPSEYSIGELKKLCFSKGYDKDSIKRAIKKLKDSGKIRKVRRGFYELLASGDRGG